MDFERNILKAMFYDYPVDHVIDLLDRNRHGVLEDVYLDVLPQLIEWRADEYTYTEANLLRAQLGNECRETNTMSISHPLNMLKDAGQKMLILNDDEPTVHFLQLFRWKDVVLHLGEDLLITAYLAAHDIESSNYIQRKDFCWRDIIVHDKISVNDVLSRGLVDLHAHYNATTDVFGMNWICLMNHVHLKEKLDDMERPQSVELLSSTSENPSSLKQQCVAAAYIRFVIFSKLYRIQTYSDAVENDYQCRIKNILRDNTYADIIEKRLQTAISYALESSMFTSNGCHIDYCIKPCQLTGNPQKDVYILFKGERELMYRFFTGFYSKDETCMQLAPYFYMYILLKNKIRREFVQINQIKGFENFEQYQDRKDLCIHKDSPIVKYYANNVVYSSIYSSASKDYIEARVTPKNYNPALYGYAQSLFGDKGTCSHHSNKTLGIVIHFIKEGKYSAMPTTILNIGKMKDGTRDDAYRRKIYHQFDKAQNTATVQKTKILGIDAASREIFCRPETFGHLFRYARLQGVQGITYHAGEDFLDIPDGLRAIDEAILFLELNENNRIGHGMALGVNAKQYYARRHYTTVIPKQNLLDDCVWLYVRTQELNIDLSPAFKEILLETAMQMYHEIGYSDWNIRHYWHSMLMRGNDPDFIYRKESPIPTKWERTAKIHNNRLDAIYCDERAKDLFHDYYYNKGIKTNGMRLVRHKWPEAISEIVTTIQACMQQIISEIGIGIECCPTSNLKIGYIDRYDEHPMFKFHPVVCEPSYPLLNVSINTDDRGVFYTSIYEEYSLMALALMKMKDEKGNRIYNDQTVLDYIERIRKSSWQMAFDKRLHAGTM